jgi:glutamine synthetase
VPKWFKQKQESARIELRCPDPTCKPYLAFAVMLKAGLDGIKDKLAPPPPLEENVFELEREGRMSKRVDVLPASLWEALNELKKSKLVQEVLSSQLLDRYITIKTKEWDEFKTQVTPWEIDKYLDVY